VNWVHIGRASGLIGSLFHDHPPNPTQERIDVDCPPSPCSAIDFNPDRLPTSSAASSVKGHLNIRMAGKTPLRRLVHQRITTGND